jgi:YHYH protein
MTDKPLWNVNSETVLATVEAGVSINIGIPVITPPVEITGPYPPLDPPVEIYNFSSYHNVGINTLRTDRFVGNATAFADANDFWVKSNGLPINRSHIRFSYNVYNAKAVNYVFQIPRQRSIQETKTPIRTNKFIGVAINGVPLAAPSTGKTHNYDNVIYTENDVLNPINFPTTDGSGMVEADGLFYYNSDPKLLYTKDHTEHSTIIGYAFDGWPIYGPYGYTNIDGTGGISIMTSSYQLKTQTRQNGTVPDGTFIEDYEYVAGSGTLDQYNGRDCVTPEYPNGVYAYFVSVNPYNPDEPVYPYILGNYYKSKPVIPNGIFVYPADMSLSVISYKLPPGLRIEGNNIVGTAFSVKTDTTFRFVIRAENITGISDKTLVIKALARTGLLWETPAGALPVGNNNLFPIPMQFDPNFLGPDLKLSNTNLTVTGLSEMAAHGSEPTVLTTYAIRDGFKVMFSMVVDTVIEGQFTAVGIATAEMDLTTYLGNTIDSIGFYDDGSVIGNQDTLYYPSGFPTMLDGYIIDVAVDRQNHLIWMRTNGGYWNNDPNQDPTTATGGIDISFIKGNVYPAVSPYNNGTKAGQFLIQQAPSFVVPYGFAFVGNEEIGDVYYILDNAPISYQLSVVDQNIALSPYLNFYIPPNGGELPLGTTLSSAGLISGFTKPVFTKVTSSTNGNYDMNLYDSGPYDYGLKPNNGFDSFFYDTEVFDYSYASNIPKKLNRYYQFIVRATDGYFYEDRQFKIYVVGDDHMRADTTLIDAGTNFYKADSTYLRKPIWLTPNNIGIRRANNYVTIPTYVYVSDSIVGVLTYILDRTNDDGSPSKMPVGLELDEKTGVIYGSIPYQPAISKSYKFTIRAYRYDPAKDITVSTARTFTLEIIGEVEATIKFTTSGDLGTIDAGLISNLSVSATTKIKNAVLSYTLVGGRLPPGLKLSIDGTIQGKVNQFSNTTGLGLTTIDKSKTTFDYGTTTVDRQFIFTVRAADQLNLSATTKTFSIEVITTSELAYSNIYVKPFLDSSVRVNVLSFFNNINIFTPSLIYRPSDTNFGIQNTLKMLIYPGIETVEASKYIGAFGRSYRKQFRLGDVKKAVAKLPGTNTVLYEVVYVEVFDNQENSNGSMASVVKINNRNYPITVNQGRSDAIDDSWGSAIGIIEGSDSYRRLKLPDRAMSADYNGQLASDVNKSTIFGNSVTNMRNNVKSLGSTKRNFLPLWMRTAQSFSGVAQSFTKAIPLCYCIPGGADTILLNIKHSGFDFKMINYTVDRAIIDSVDGYIGDKYLMFPAREVING